MPKSNKQFKLELWVGGKLDASLHKACLNAQGELNRLGKAAQLLKYAGIASVGLAAVEAGKKLITLGENFEDAYNKIRIGTGATGEQLQSLETSMKNVYATVPGSLEDASTAISDFNTRLGVNGETLETLSEQALLVSKMLGDDVSSVVKGSSQALQQWKISQDNMSSEMDYIFRISQSIGIGFTELMDQMAKYGSQLQSLGYDFDSAAALLGKLNKAGYNTEQVFSGLKQAVNILSKQGVSAADGLQIYYDQIKNAHDETEAITIATQVFGSEAGSVLARAIRDGTVDVADFVQQMQNGGDTIKGVGEETYTFADRMQMLKQKLSAKLEPIALAFLDKIEQLSPILDVIAQLIQTIFSLAQSLDSTFGIFSYGIERLQFLFDILKNLLSFVANVFAGNWKDAWKGLGNATIAVLNFIISGFEAMINAIIGLINTLTQALSKIWTWTGLPGIPEIPKVHFGRIPAMAEGGIVTASTLALVGEGKEPEAVLPLSKLADIMTNKGYDTTTNNNNLSSVSSFSPQITINITNAGEDVQKQITQNLTDQLENWWNNKQRLLKRTSF